MSFLERVLAIFRSLFNNNSTKGGKDNFVAHKDMPSLTSTTVSDSKVAVEAFESYPTTKPAFRIKVKFTEKFACGDIYTGSTLVAVPFSGGTCVSVGDFEPKMDFTINYGTDWFRIDADKSHGRLTVKAIATDAEGRSICLILDGLTPLNETTMPMILGAPEAATYSFGYGVELVKIEAGHDVYKPLEGMVFGASQRFLKEDDGSVGVELRIARIIPGSGML